MINSRSASITVWKRSKRSKFLRLARQEKFNNGGLVEQFLRDSSKRNI